MSYILKIVQVDLKPVVISHSRSKLRNRFETHLVNCFKDLQLFITVNETLMIVCLNPFPFYASIHNIKNHSNNEV